MAAPVTAEEPELPDIPYVFEPEEEDEEKEPVPSKAKPEKPAKKKRNGKNGEVVVIRPAKSAAPEPVKSAAFINPNLQAASPVTSYAGAAAKPAEPEKPALDLSGIAEGSKVMHKSFGEGTVTKLDKAGKHLRVQFAAGEKTFIFPDAFINGFLSV